MIESLGCNSHGVAEYAITDINEVEKLPTMGIANSSSAILVQDDGVLRVWIFKTTGRKEIGKWIELK